MIDGVPKIEDSPRTVSRSSLAFLSGTFLSRLSGLGRDMSLAFCFGSHPALAAFMVAFRFANLIRRLFGEGPLSSGFIPYFEQVRSSSPEKGAQFFRDLIFSLAFILCLVIGVAEAVLAAIWQWGHLSPDASQIIYLMILMLPGIFFICLFGVCSGLLQCERKFFLTGFAPVAFNLVWIGAAWWLRRQEPSAAAVYLSLAVVVAFFMQWATIAPHTISFLKRFMTWRALFSARLFSSEMRQVIKPFLLGAVGVGAVQINSALDGIFARFACLEGPAYLWYAIRLQQAPLALFGIALSAAILPPLSRAIKENTVDLYLRLLRFALRRSFSLIFPCTMGIFVIGIAMVNLIYGRGGFSNEATYNTAICLWAYGLGLIPAVLVLILAPAFYAKKDFRTPTLGSVYAVIFNIFISAFLVFVLKWGAFSIAVATSVCAWINYFYLSYHLSQKIGPIWNKTVTRSFIKTGSCTLIASAITLLVGFILIGDSTVSVLAGRHEGEFPRVFSAQLLHFVALGGTFVLMVFSYAWMFNATDLLELAGIRKSENPLESDLPEL